MGINGGILRNKMAAMNTNNTTTSKILVKEAEIPLLMGGVGGEAPQVFRYKMSDEIMQLVTHFAKIHQYDDRHSYKEAWGQWLEEYSELIEREVSRLEQLGYKGDVIDKMFKAGRYYFREKKGLENNIKVVEEPTKQRRYCVMNADVIKAMDNHLLLAMKQLSFKPSKAYTQFCEQNIDVLRKEITRMSQGETTMTANELSEKIKKTYKNRYYILQQSRASGQSMAEQQSSRAWQSSRA